MTIINKFSEIHWEMKQELETFLINLSFIKKVADEGSIEVEAESFAIEVSDDMVEVPRILFKWTRDEVNKEFGIKLNWHDLIFHYMEESELFEFCRLISRYIALFEKSFLTHGLPGEFDLENYDDIARIHCIAWAATDFGRDRESVVVAYEFEDNNY